VDSDNERANEHLTCLQENAGYVGLVINLMKTKALFLNCDPTSLVVLEGEVAQVEDFCYHGSMISSSLQDLRRRPVFFNWVSAEPRLKNMPRHAG